MNTTPKAVNRRATGLEQAALRAVREGREFLHIAPQEALLLAQILRELAAARPATRATSVTRKPNEGKQNAAE